MKPGDLRKSLVAVASRIAAKSLARMRLRGSGSNLSQLSPDYPLNQQVLSARACEYDRNSLKQELKIER